MKTRICIGAVVCLLVAVVVLCLPKVQDPGVGGASAEGDGGAKAEPTRAGRRPPRVIHKQTVNRARPPKPQLDLVDDDDDDKRTPAEKALAERIEKALEDESLQDAISCAQQAQLCGNVDIRRAMVETLGWFGEKALPELTPFLADPDEDVRDSAMNEWSMAVSGIEDEAEKIGVVELAMNVLTDEDALEDISGEYIGIDEKLAVESLVRLIEANGSRQGVAKAKETYEFVTGDEWQSKEAAAKWIAEEYQPDETDAR